MLYVLSSPPSNSQNQNLSISQYHRPRSRIPPSSQRQQNPVLPPRAKHKLLLPPPANNPNLARLRPLPGHPNHPNFYHLHLQHWSSSSILHQPRPQNLESKVQSQRCTSNLARHRICNPLRIRDIECAREIRWPAKTRSHC